MSTNNTLSQLKKTRYSYFLTISFISLVNLILLVFSTNAHSEQVTVSWNPNSESDLAGYKVYYGNSSGNYDTNIDVANQTSYTITNLMSGETIFIAATAYDLAGNESGYSNEVFYNVPPVNSPPTLDPIADITVNEGETVTINPGATDSDGDALTYTYSGWMISASYTTNHNDAGTYTVTVTVSDGSFTDSQDVTIIVNDMDTIKPLPPGGLRTVKS